MKDEFQWGASAQAILPEFATGKIRKIEKHCRKLIAKARALDHAGYRVGAIPFEDDDGYVFLLERVAVRTWSLEVVQLPPHAPNRRSGARISGARRAREVKERKEKKAASRPRRLRRVVQQLLIDVRRALRRSEFGHKLRRASAAMIGMSYNVGAHYRSVTTRLRATLHKLQAACERVLYRTRGYVENRKRAERIDTTLEFVSGMRLESRLFTIGRLQIRLNTWTPIDPGFDQVWDISLFGVRMLESERL